MKQVQLQPKKQLQPRRRKRPRGRLLPLLLAATLALPPLTLSAAAEAATEPTVARATVGIPTAVTLNGERVLAGQTVRLGGVTYVPLRFFSELMGECNVRWNGAKNTATVETDRLTLTARTGDLYIVANGWYLYTVNPVENLNGRIYVPIRPLARAFGAEVEWDAASETAHVVKRSAPISRASYNETDLYWLSRIISAEARGEPFSGKIAVGNVVMNRTRHRSYPSTVKGVIFDRRHGVQFTPTVNGEIYRAPTEESVIAAKICLAGYTLSEDVLFFFNPRISTSSWIDRNRPYAFTIGNHWFYR